MTEENFRLQSDQSVEYYLVTIFEKIENIRCESINVVDNTKSQMRMEIRTLEFWRSVISECFASFVYVFVVCGAAAGAGVGAPIYFVLLATSLASGFVITSLTQCFGHISGKYEFWFYNYVASAITIRIFFLDVVMLLWATQYTLSFEMKHVSQFFKTFISVSKLQFYINRFWKIFTIQWLIFYYEIMRIMRNHVLFYIRKM